MTNPLRLLLVEDERDLVQSIAEFLQARGHVVDIAWDGETGLGLALENSYDAMVLDLGLPRRDGLSVCEAIRASASNGISILMLTARDTLDDKLTGFDSGADDYLVKPFSLPELERRLIALARRSVLNKGAELSVGNLVYHLGRDELTRNGHTININPACRRLLRCLMQYSPNTVSRADLEYALWGDSPPMGEGLKSHIHLLRQALDRESGVQTPGSGVIETVRGKGYRIVS